MQEEHEREEEQRRREREERRQEREDRRSRNRRGIDAELFNGRMGGRHGMRKVVVALFFFAAIQLGHYLVPDHYSPAPPTRGGGLPRGSTPSAVIERREDGAEIARLRSKVENCERRLQGREAVHRKCQDELSVMDLEVLHHAPCLPVVDLSWCVGAAGAGCAAD